MRVTHNLRMDLARCGCRPIVAAVQGEANTRVLVVSLFDNGVAWTAPEGTTAAVAFQKPDGTRGLYDTLPDGNTPAATIEGSTVTAILAPQVLTCAGSVLASIVFYDEDLDTLATFPFKITVEANPAAGEQISNDFYYLKTLDEVNAAYKALLDRVTDMEQNGSTGKTFKDIEITEKADGSVTMLNTFTDDTSETIVLAAGEKPANITYNGVKIPIKWVTEEVSQ